MKTTILAVDDDQPMLWLIAKILKEFEVVCFSDGLDAMAWMAKGNRPDLILLDREMPVVGGVKFFKALKGSGLYRDIPVMFISSWVDNKFENDLKQLNVSKIIEKPFDPTFLLNQVKLFV